MTRDETTRNSVSTPHMKYRCIRESRATIRCLTPTSYLVTLAAVHSKVVVMLLINFSQLPPLFIELLFLCLICGCYAVLSALSIFFKSVALLYLSFLCLVIVSILGSSSWCLGLIAVLNSHG